jgi:hypothetical protein
VDVFLSEIITWNLEVNLDEAPIFANAKLSNRSCMYQYFTFLFFVYRAVYPTISSSPLFGVYDWLESRRAN